MSLLEDDNDYKTGERVAEYDNPVPIDRMNVSVATNYAHVADFGKHEDYQALLATQDMSCPINEHSLLWVYRDPQVDSEGKPTISHDYVVRRVGRTINVIVYAIARVDSTDDFGDS